MNTHGQKRLAGLAAAGLTIALLGCATPPAGASSPSATMASPAVASAAPSTDCAAVLLLRAAYGTAAKAASAVAAGRTTGVSDLSIETQSEGAAVLASLPGKVAGQPVPPFRKAVIGGALAVDQFAFPLASWDEAPYDPAQVAAAFASAQQVVGSVEAVATVGADGQPPACPEIAPLAVPLPTLSLRTPGPTPSAGPAATQGPVSRGTVADQQAAALKALKLRAAAGITLDAGGRVQWEPTGLILRGIALDNYTQATVSVSSDLTALRWDGSAWQRLPCGDGSSAFAGGSCGANINTEPVTPGRHAGLNELWYFLWPWTEAVPPGTYALVVPVWRGSPESPAEDPTEAAVAIVTLAVSP